MEKSVPQGRLALAVGELEVEWPVLEQSLHHRNVTAQHTAVKNTPANTIALQKDILRYLLKGYFTMFYEKDILW